MHLFCLTNTSALRSHKACAPASPCLIFLMHISIQLLLSVSSKFFTSTFSTPKFPLLFFNTHRDINTCGSLPHSLIPTYDRSNIHISYFALFLCLSHMPPRHTHKHTHTCQVIHPRGSIQHLVDKALSPATSPGLPFTGPWRFLMDHPRTRMNGASSPLLHLRCHFILSTLLICHSRWPFVTSLELLCTLHMHACLHMATKVISTPHPPTEEACCLQQ